MTDVVNPADRSGRHDAPEWMRITSHKYIKKTRVMGDRFDEICAETRLVFDLMASGMTKNAITKKLGRYSSYVQHVIKRANALGIL